MAPRISEVRAVPEEASAADSLEDPADFLARAADPASNRQVAHLPDSVVAAVRVPAEVAGEADFRAVEVAADAVVLVVAVASAAGVDPAAVDLQACADSNAAAADPKAAKPCSAIARAADSRACVAR